MTAFRPLFPAMLLVCALCQRSAAGPVLNDPETWPGPGLDGWGNAPPEGTGKATLTAPGFLNITFGAQPAGPPVFEEDTVYTKSADETGNFQDVMLRLRFDFSAEDVLPLGSALYFHEAGRPVGEHWAYAFANGGAGGWQTHVINFDYASGWSGPGGALEFWAALANVDWIGINIARKLDKIQQDYGLDNWEYYSSSSTAVPEPGTCCMLASALLSVAFTFRKRLNPRQSMG